MQYSVSVYTYMSNEPFFFFKNFKFFNQFSIFSSFSKLSIFSKLSRHLSIFSKQFWKIWQFWKIRKFWKIWKNWKCFENFEKILSLDITLWQVYLTLLVDHTFNSMGKLICSHEYIIICFSNWSRSRKRPFVTRWAWGSRTECMLHISQNNYFEPESDGACYRLLTAELSKCHAENSIPKNRLIISKFELHHQ